MCFLIVFFVFSAKLNWFFLGKSTKNLIKNLIKNLAKNLVKNLAKLLGPRGGDFFLPSTVAQQMITV